MHNKHYQIVLSQCHYKIVLFPMIQKKKKKPKIQVDHNKTASTEFRFYFLICCQVFYSIPILMIFHEAENKLFFSALPPPQSYILELATEF